MGLEGWKHGAETQEQLLAEGRALGKTRTARSSDGGYSVPGKVARIPDSAGSGEPLKSSGSEVSMIR